MSMIPRSTVLTVQPVLLLPASFADDGLANIVSGDLGTALEQYRMGHASMSYGGELEECLSKIVCVNLRL